MTSLSRLLKAIVVTLLAVAAAHLILSDTLNLGLMSQAAASLGSPQGYSYDQAFTTALINTALVMPLVLWIGMRIAGERGLKVMVPVGTAGWIAAVWHGVDLIDDRPGAILPWHSLALVVAVTSLASLVPTRAREGRVLDLSDGGVQLGGEGDLFVEGQSVVGVELVDTVDEASEAVDGPGCAAGVDEIEVGCRPGPGGVGTVGEGVAHVAVGDASVVAREAQGVEGGVLLDAAGVVGDEEMVEVPAALLQEASVDADGVDPLDVRAERVVAGGR
ncbi:hypothetical protein ACH414_31745 [Streptomyces sp. NPDC020422]|uniref:hypothetical protein n=1 Tax=Streptomyces sp. NPDC020422 TaxID=3365074 RepID=UPI0037AEA11A